MPPPQELVSTQLCLRRVLGCLEGHVKDGLDDLVRQALPALFRLVFAGLLRRSDNECLECLRGAHARPLYYQVVFGCVMTKDRKEKRVFDYEEGAMPTS